MKLLRIRTENFAGLADRTFSSVTHSGTAARTVLVSGAASCGKTSLLSAIIAAKENLAPYGLRPNLRARAGRSDRAVVLETAWKIDEAERDAFGGSPVIEATVRAGDDDVLAVPSASLSGILGAYSHELACGKVDFFPEQRSLGRPPTRLERPRTETEERLVRLSDDPRKYRSVWRYLRDLAIRGAVEQEAKLRREGALLADEAGTGLAGFAKPFSKLTDAVALVGQENESLLFQDRAGRRFGPAGLSASAADALLFAGSLLMVGHQRSVILIDRVDLYRQASDAVKFIRGLRELVGDSQIIATTSSKELADSGVADCVINLDEAR